jgi:Ca2+-binding RTX toxin-like protein
MTGTVDERSAEVCWYESTTVVGTPGNDVVRPNNRRGRISSPCSEARIGFTQATAATGSAGMSDRTLSTAILEETHYEGADGDDVLLGMGGRDRLSGAVGDDYLDGGALRDTAHAGAGDDTVVAREGRDALLGHEGNDRLDAADGSHNDLINGGPGFDRCRFDEGDWVLRCEVERVVSDA